jgi:galactonate dehydratase
VKVTGLKTFICGGEGRNWLFVKVETDEGIHGWGEGTVERRERTVETAIHELGEALVGEDPTKLEKNWQRLFRLFFWKGGVILASALSALDQACWDITGKALGQPIYRLLGGPARDRVRLYTHVGIYEPTQMIEEVARFQEQGFNAFKTGAWPGMAKLGEREAVRLFADRVARLRDAVGPTADLMIDNHGRSRPSAAIRLMRALEPFELYFFEEPTPPENLDALAKVVEAGFEMDLAAGERLYTKWGFRELLERQLVNVVQPDICHAGGITELKKIAALAETYYVSLAPHNPQGPISLAASVQLAAAIPNFAILEYVPNQPRRDQIQHEPLVVRQGQVELPARPGLGVDLDEDALRAHPFRPMRRTADETDADGAVVDV